MGRQPQILLIDDSDAVRRLLTCILTVAGFEVVAAEGVREALRKLRSVTPDVILTDFNMPGLNGEALVRLVRRDPRFADTPIIVVSSETAGDISRRMAAAGANAWLGKPVDASALVQAVQSICEFGAQAPFEDDPGRENQAVGVRHAQL